MTLAIGVGVAAAVGAAARYVLDLFVQHQHTSGLPWGTFLVNVTGSFVLGLVAGLAVHEGLSADSAAILGTGLLGGYTTWSTLSWESFALAEQGRLRAAAVNMVGGLGMGLLAAAAGLGVALLASS